MNEEPSIRYTRIRKVKELVRANAGDAGIDFYCPEDLTFKQVVNVLAEQVIETYGVELQSENYIWVVGAKYALVKVKNPITTNAPGPQGNVPCDKVMDEVITKIVIRPQARVLIPSGIRVLLTPRRSMFMAANKSGVSTKTGLIYGAEIVDTPYTGEVHLSIINTSKSDAEIEAGKKVVQFIHVPIYDTEPEEIPVVVYDAMAKNWGTRGSKGFGSSDDQGKDSKLSLEDELNIRDAQFS